MKKLEVVAIWNLSSIKWRQFLSACIEIGIFEQASLFLLFQQRQPGLLCFADVLGLLWRIVKRKGSYLQLPIHSNDHVDYVDDDYDCTSTE